MELLRQNPMILQLLYAFAAESQVLISRRALGAKLWSIAVGSAKPRIGKQGTRRTAQRSTCSAIRKKNNSAHRRQLMQLAQYCASYEWAWRGVKSRLAAEGGRDVVV